MAALFAGLAALVVLAHAAFVAFAVSGAFLALRRRWVPWLHVPAAGWAAYIELSGGICPLTPIENALRARAGLDAYSGDFIARYLLPVLYPEGLTRGMQVTMGAAVILVNLVVYAWVAYRRSHRQHAY